MIVRYYKEKDYDQFISFWNYYNHDIIEKEMLSPLGIVVEDGNFIVGGTWLYVMNGCDVVQIAWTTLNPKSKIKQKHKCLKSLHAFIIKTCKQLNKSNIVMFCDKSGLNKFFNKNGLDMYSEHTLLRGKIK